MPGKSGSASRHPRKKGGGGGLGAAIRNERFDQKSFKFVRNIGDTDTPKNAHLVGDWENLETEERANHVAQISSITDQDDLGALLDLADLADRDFTSQRHNVRIVDGATAIERRNLEKLPEELKKLPIPVRPMWNKTMTAEQVDRNEKLAFLEWRRGLAKTEEKYDVVMTPFEKNLEFWRQLWRVVEKSDVVVQVVDARNPLLYRCTSFEEYVRSVGAWKTNVILLNKADLLPLHLRKAWARELAGLGIRCFFFAAKEEIEENHAAEVAAMREEEANMKEGNKEEDGEEEEEEEEEEDEVEAEESAEAGAAERDGSSGGGGDDIPEAKAGEKQDKKEEGEEEEGIDTKLLNSTNLLTTLEKIGKECVARASSHRFPTKETVLGFVGYPNVGKSSTINALVGRKRVGVSATAGKTKHFQTLFVSEELMLCDCPGLVFPSVVSSRAEMVCGGILPLNALRDHVGPMELVASRVPRTVFEQAYNIILPDTMPDGRELVYNNWRDVTAGYAVSRGLLMAGGTGPDHHTTSIRLLKDYVSGRLRYCHAPPGIEDVASCQVNTGDEEAGNKGVYYDGPTDGGGGASGKVGAAAGGVKGGGGGGGGGQLAGGAHDKHNPAEPANRANRGLSAGIYATDPEADVYKSQKGNVMAHAAGRAKKGKGKYDFARVTRPYSSMAIPADLRRGSEQRS